MKITISGTSFVGLSHVKLIDCTLTRSARIGFVQSKVDMLNQNISPIFDKKI